MLAAAATLVMVWIAAWIDVRSRRIPNPITLLGAAAGLLVHAYGSGLYGVADSVLGLALGLALMLPGYLLHSTGAGDVKLMAAVGAILGPKGVAVAFFFSILIGASIGVGYALAAWLGKGAKGPLSRYAGMLRFLIVTGRFSYVPPGPDEALGQRFAFGVPIAIGSTVAVLWPLLSAHRF